MRRFLDALERRSVKLFENVEASTPIACVAIVLLALVMLLPGQASLPLTERDEARFVQASKQMVESGNYIEPRLLDQPRWKKPIGIYWLQTGVVHLSGWGADAPVWVYRLPSLLGIIAAALLSFWAFLPLIGRGPAAFSGIVVATSTLTAIEGHIAKTDAALLASIVLAQGSLIRVYLHQEVQKTPWFVWMFWVGLALGTLIKGPIIWLVAAGTVLTLTIWDRSLRLLTALRLLRGFAVMFILTAPWYLAIGFATDWAFYAEALGRDLLGKVNNASEGHDGPPGFYLMTMWITFWPWMAFVFLALPLAVRNWQTPALRVIISWVVPTWTVFAVITTKLPHYIMPILPALGALIGLWVFSETKMQWRVLNIFAAFVFFVGGAVIIAVIVALPIWLDRIMLAPLILGLLGGLTIVHGIQAIILGQKQKAVYRSIGAAFILLPTLLGVTLPYVRTLHLSPQLARLDASFDRCAPAPLVIAGYQEVSLAFYADKATSFTAPEAALDYILMPQQGTRAVLPVAFVEALPDTETGNLQQIGEVTGINYNDGSERLRFGLYKKQDDPILAPCVVP